MSDIEDGKAPAENRLSLDKARIRSAQDLRSLPSYREPIDPTSEPLKRIVKHYNLAEQAQCGLSSCRQWHYDGYVVELESGGLTNVGHICGKHFGDKFAIEERVYKERILRPGLIRKLGLGKSRIEQARPAIDDLFERAQVLLRRRIGLREQFPGLYAALSRRASEGKAELVEDIERSEREIEDALAINPSQRREALKYRQVSRGRIAGLPFITANVSGVVFDELHSRSTEFRTLEGLHLMDINKLLDWERWLDNLDTRLKEGERIIADGEALFRESNLTQLDLIAQDPKEKRGIARIKLVDLEKVPRESAEAAAGQVRTPNRRERRRRAFIDWASKLGGG